MPKTFMARFSPGRRAWFAAELLLGLLSSASLLDISPDLTASLTSFFTGGASCRPTWRRRGARLCIRGWCLASAFTSARFFSDAALGISACSAHSPALPAGFFFVGGEGGALRGECGNDGGNEDRGLELHGAFSLVEWTGPAFCWTPWRYPLSTRNVAPWPQSRAMETWSVFLSSLLVGLSIAAPVGPIGLLTIQRSLEHGPRAGLATGLGAAAADAVYGPSAPTA